VKEGKKKEFCPETTCFASKNSVGDRLNLGGESNRKEEKKNWRVDAKSFQTVGSVA